MPGKVVWVEIRSVLTHAHINTSESYCRCREEQLLLTQAFQLTLHSSQSILVSGKDPRSA